MSDLVQDCVKWCVGVSVDETPVSFTRELIN